MFNRSISSPDHSAHAGTTRRRLSRGIAAIGAAALISVAPLTHATQLNFATTPLFLQTVVQPNILFLLDDSGSMDWNLMTTEGDGIIDPGPPGCGDIGWGDGGWWNRVYFYTHPTPGVSGSANAPARNHYDNLYLARSYVVATEEELIARGVAAPYGGVWRAWNKDYNGMYYDPAIRYTPWEGVNVSGTAYSDAPAAAAPYNPYRPADGTINLTATTSYTTDYCPSGGGTFTVSSFYPARYYTWTDSNGNGVADATDSHMLVEIRSSTSSYPKAATRTDCAGSTCTYAEEIQNFANWFSYYRKRDLTAKNATSKTVAPLTSRVGYASLHNNSGSNNIQIALMNASTLSGNKKTLLDGVFNTRPDGGTPLRRELDKAGKYYECVSGNTFGLSTGSASCPILPAASGGNCQQNFTVLLSDGFYNDSFTGLPGDDNVDADGDSPNTTGNTAFDGGAYADTYADTLADVAMHYYERDLSSSLANDVSVVEGIDNARHQHMVTYTVAFGVTGTLSAGPASGATSFAWPNPAAGDAEKIDDMRHAAYNGRGTFLSARNPDQLSSSLTSAIASIADRTGSAASVAVNSRSLNTETRLYQATFTSTEWSGDLRALSINPSTGAVGSEVWSAKSQLESQDWSSGREIITRFAKSGLGTGCAADTSSTTEGGAAFLWASLSTAQQCMLNNNPATVALDNDSKGSARLNFLRGDDTDEGGDFRTRAAKLGDIVNSSPIYVGAPPFLPDIESVTHSSFRSTYYNRQAMVYVGGNDGMLHGFNASTGGEEIAYLPSMVFPNLAELTYTSYTHRYFVDGSPTAGDAFGAFTNVTGACGSGCWRTVLVSGMGSGAKGVFALDVTDPAGASIGGLSFDESNASKIALWEFTDSTTPADMGFVLGRPTIARVRTSATTSAWAAIFGNGYNSTNERAILYVVNIVTGAIIRKIDLSNGATGTSNGLSTAAAVDTDGDYLIDYVYAGDLRGNLWKIDLTNSNTSNWGSYYTKSGNPAPLFIATDSNGSRQPITVRPEVSEHPDGAGGYMVYFGTGKYLENGDKTAPTTYPPGVYNNFYGIWDPHSGASLGGSDTARVSKARLRSQTVSSVTYSGVEYRTVTDNRLGSAGSEGDAQTWNETGTACNSAGGKCMGWVVSVPGAGEMMVSNPVLLGGSVPRIIFTTIVPENAACSYGGQSWLMELNPIHGGRFTSDVFGLTSAIGASNAVTIVGVNPQIGIMPEPTILRDPANSRDLKILTGSSGTVTSVANSSGKPSGGRQSWRQLK